MYWGTQKAHTDNNAFQGYFTQETTRWAPTLNGITVNGIITLINGQPYLELGEVPPCTATKKEHWKQLLILISPVFPGDWRMVKSIEIQFFFHRELQDFAMWMFTYRASNDWIPPVLSLFKLQYFLLLYPILPTHFSWRHEIPNVRKARRLSATVPGGVQLSPWLESCFKSTYSDQTPPVFSEFPLNFSGDLSVFYAETILV